MKRFFFPTYPDEINFLCERSHQLMNYNDLLVTHKTYKQNKRERKKKKKKE